MPIYVPPSRKDVTAEFVPCPAGNHNAVCVDVSLPYLHRGEYQGKVFENVVVHLAFQVSRRMENNGKPFMVMQRYTVSLWKKANLLPVFRALMLREPTDAEVNDGVFDLEEFLGRPCTVMVVHKPGKEGRVFANVTAVTPHMEGMPVLVPEQYDRWQVRDKKPGWWPSEPVRISPDEDFNALGSEPGDTDIPF